MALLCSKINQLLIFEFDLRASGSKINSPELPHVKVPYLFDIRHAFGVQSLHCVSVYGFIVRCVCLSNLCFLLCEICGLHCGEDVYFSCSGL